MATATRRAVFAPSPSAPARGTSLKINAFGDDSVIYANGKAIIIRNLHDPTKTFTYAHTKETTVAALSPDGHYVASADVSGTVKVWDATPARKGTTDEPVLKNEVKALSGRVNDLAWCETRIIAVGEGKEKFGNAFTFDSGNSVGEISGHSKPINSISVRQNRPFRAVTGSDDNGVVHLTGVPFKFARAHKQHTSFVHSVAYSPNGAFFSSAGADRKIFIYDGTSGDLTATLSGHEGSIFACAWSSDNTTLASASADGTCRLWDTLSHEEIMKWDLGKGDSVGGQQVGLCWVGETIVSVSANGDLNVIDKRESKVSRVNSGHQRSITCLTSLNSPSGKTLYSGSYDGRCNSYDATSGECIPASGSGHSSQIIDVQPASAESICTAGMDDTMRFVDSKGPKFQSNFSSTASLPKSLACDQNGTTFLLTIKDLQVHNGGSKTASVALKDTPVAMSYSVAGAKVAVASESGSISFYSKELKEESKKLNAGGAVSALAYSPDGKWLAIGYSAGKILVYDTEALEAKINSWVFHSAKINCITWSADSMYAASGSLDSNVYVWSIAKPMRKLAIRNVHLGGVTGVEWVKDNEIATAGADSCIKLYAITLPA